MAMSVTYTNFNGQLVHENRQGTERFYAPDTLGSTAALLDPTGTVTDTFTYWPYGEIWVHTGPSTTPFTFVGTLGYYLDISGSLIYIRARHLRQALCRWQTADPVTFIQLLPYVYAWNDPISKMDTSGLLPQASGCSQKTGTVNLVVGAFCSALNSQQFANCVAQCQNNAWGSSGGGDYVSCAKAWCNGGGIECSNSCPPNVCAQAPPKGGSGCTVTICPAMFTSKGCFNPSNWNAFIGILSHELGHCCSNQNTNDTDPDPNQWPPGAICNRKAEDCITANCKALQLVAFQNSMNSIPFGVLS